MKRVVTARRAFAIMAAIACAGIVAISDNAAYTVFGCFYVSVMARCGAALASGEATL